MLRTDPLSGATSHLLTLEVARRRTPVSLERILRIADADDASEFLINSKSGKVALKVQARWLMEEKDGTPIPRVELMRPTRRKSQSVADMFETAWKTITREEFAERWATEAEEAAQTLERETIRIATGLLLPIWSALPSDHLIVNRIATADGRSWLGRIVYVEHVAHLYTKLGVDRADNLPADQIAKSVLSGRSVDLVRPFAMTVKRAIVNGKPRIELVGVPAARLPWQQRRAGSRAEI